MTISATIIADSINPSGVRLTTMQLRYPRFIHAEFMTHRVFSRNASSSRAIPVKRLIEDVIRDTAMPIHWGKNQPGMQAREEHQEDVPYPHWNIDDRDAWEVMGNREEAWIAARDAAIQFATGFDRAGYHKQIVNRLLEPFSHINVVVTATDWDNFYELRRHADAQPEIKALADAMFDAQSRSKPRMLKNGEWHLPYIDEDDWRTLGWSDARIAELLHTNIFQVEKKAAIRLSVARCARVSYLTHDGEKPNIEDDLALYDRLVGSVPLHASPAEHQATPANSQEDILKYGSNFHYSWVQYRKMLEAPEFA